MILKMITRLEILWRVIACLHQMMRKETSFGREMKKANDSSKHQEEVQFSFVRFDNGEKDVMYENLAANGITVGGGQGGKDNAVSVYTCVYNIWQYTVYFILYREENELVCPWQWMNSTIRVNLASQKYSFWTLGGMEYDGIEGWREHDLSLHHI